MAKDRKKRASRKRAQTNFIVCQNGHAQLVEVDVPSTSHNPRYEATGSNRATERAWVNDKESPAHYWYYHGHINQAQWEAASKLRNDYELASGSLAMGIDYERIKVDTFGVADPISARREASVKSLTEAQRVIRDPATWDAVHRVCCECQNPTKIWTSSLARRTMIAEIKAALTELSVVFGLATGENLRKTG